MGDISGWRVKLRQTSGADGAERPPTVLMALAEQLERTIDTPAGASSRALELP